MLSSSTDIFNTISGDISGDNMSQRNRERRKNDGRRKRGFDRSERRERFDWNHREKDFDVRRGDFRFLILMAIAEKPMHGYALIQELGTTYQRPVSAGLVYPTLQELDDMGYVSLEEKNGKRVYSITAEGRKYLEQNEELVGRLQKGREHAGWLGKFGFLGDVRDIKEMIMTNNDYVDEEKMKKIQEIIAETKKKIAAVVFS